ncbi:MAG: bifunctional phosphopantothenoylcysteine decarboxylase/phosphopantothenate--cysteine ligase CoaBC [Deltaproteobacteria bacterium]|nr:bifunctional phosphopantothenoylcysteine decarboxylase/phosphopantothenate--cysteine ligase CoaBC [Deltaproteobacteria bacterium]
MPDPLRDKQIVVGVCGGIAAYKAAAFVRYLMGCGAAVRVIMTEAACAFVGPVTFQALSGHPVWTRMFSGDTEGAIRHIEWARKADAVAIVPATANTIAKLAHGIADDPISTFVLAVRCPVVVCPSMNVHMFENRTVQANIERLRQVGMHVVEPASGPLACGEEGPGRLPELETIAEGLRWALVTQDMAGERVLVTAGPTREALDPVRFLSNASSGKMGFALARTARRRGAEVVLISGPTALSDPDGVRTIHVVTAKEMLDAVMAEAAEATIVAKAAAVCDWRSREVSPHKLKKDQSDAVWAFEKTDDILETLGKQKKDGQILVGFAAETQDLNTNARTKLAQKHLDLVVANLVGKEDSGFEVDTNRVRLFYPDGREEDLPLMPKADVADALWDRIMGLRAGAEPGKSALYESGDARSAGHDP